jgi:hypothetical protein
MAALYFCIIGQGGDYRCGRVYSHSIFVDGAWAVCFYCGHFRPRISGVSARRINLLKCYFACDRFVREPKEWVSRHRSKSCDRGGLRLQLGAISGPPRGPARVRQSFDCYWSEAMSVQVWFGCSQTAKRRPMDAIPPRYNGAI